VPLDARETDLGSLFQKGLRELCAALNETPRRCLSFGTPAEVFRAHGLGRGHRKAKLSTKPKSDLK
jgi:IS30 family transposase